MFIVGQNVVHPAYGAGTVVDVDSRSIGARSNNYYIIEILDATHASQVMVPVRRADELGLRPVGNPSALRDVLACCKEPFEGDYEHDYRRRYASETDQIKSGCFEVVADLVRTLTFINSQRPLGNTERDLLRSAKEMLVSEFALATGHGLEHAGEVLAETMSEMLEGCDARA